MKFVLYIFMILFLCFTCVYAFGQEDDNETEDEIENEINDQPKKETKGGIVPLTVVFHNIGWNALHSITYNYGLNFIGAGLGTWAFIASGVDWEWNRLAYNNDWMPRTGVSANYIGYAVPALTPVALYVTGISIKDEKLQISGLALTQTLMLTMSFQSILKITTGRTLPGIVNGWDSASSRRSDRTDDYSGEFNWFVLEAVGGWPSGHTANAFAAAATLSQIYHDSVLLKVSVYTYASLIGLGMSIYDHWASDIFAGALIGFAIGTTVGKSYRNLIEKRENKLNFYVTPNSLGVIIKR